MKIADVMTRNLTVAKPTDTVAEVARQMSEIDSGVVPIVEYDHVVGVITDRDIVIRVIGEGHDGEIPVGEVMTTAVVTCSESDDIDGALSKMSEHQLRRIMVVDQNGRLAGVLSLGDVAKTDRPRTVGQTLEEISQ